jgi:hypothetical protein
MACADLDVLAAAQKFTAVIEIVDELMLEESRLGEGLCESCRMRAYAMAVARYLADVLLRRDDPAGAESVLAWLKDELAFGRAVANFGRH